VITFPVTVKILDFTLLQNALHGSKICINQEACTNIINDNLNEAQKIKIQFSDEVGYDSENAKKYLFRRIKAGHESVVEHIILVVEVSNISRAFLQQFARHRLLSMSVQSTRWALRTIIDDYIELVMPEEIKEDPDFKPYVIEWLSHGAVLVQKIRERYGNDVAKYLLPECIPTKI